MVRQGLGGSPASLCVHSFNAVFVQSSELSVDVLGMPFSPLQSLLLYVLLDVGLVARGSQIDYASHVSGFVAGAAAAGIVQQLGA